MSNHAVSNVAAASRQKHDDDGEVSCATPDTLIIKQSNSTMSSRSAGNVLEEERGTPEGRLRAKLQRNSHSRDADEAPSPSKKETASMAADRNQLRSDDANTKGDPRSSTMPQPRGNKTKTPLVEEVPVIAVGEVCRDGPTIHPRSKNEKDLEPTVEEATVTARTMDELYESTDLPVQQPTEEVTRPGAVQVRGMLSRTTTQSNYSSTMLIQTADGQAADIETSMLVEAHLVPEENEPKAAFASVMEENMIGGINVKDRRAQLCIGLGVIVLLGLAIGLGVSSGGKSGSSAPSTESMDLCNLITFGDGSMQAPEKIIRGELDDDKRIEDEFMVTFAFFANGSRPDGFIAASCIEKDINDICTPGSGLGNAMLEKGVGDEDYTFTGSPDCIAAVCHGSNIIRWCEENAWASLDSDSSSLSWGLDRIDQANGTDGTFFMHEAPYASSIFDGGSSYNNTGVQVYILDSGLDASHRELTRVGAGIDILSGKVTDNTVNNDECNHGTRMAGIICGKSTGVAPGVTIHSVKVFAKLNSCRGKWSDIASGLRWINSHHTEKYHGSIGIVNLSFGGSSSPTINDLVKRISTKLVNLILVASAGNDNGRDACTNTPSGAARAITAAASKSNDDFWTSSNVGSCIDIIAPGVDILSSSSGGGYSTFSGTSASAAYVTGALALVVEEKSSLPFNTEQNTGLNSIFQRVRNLAVKGVVTGIPDDDGTPNLLLNIEFHRDFIAREQKKRL